MNCMDSTMDNVENTKFLTVYGGMIKQFLNTTEFSYNEIVCLLIVYYKFVQINGKGAKMMTKKQLYILFQNMFRINDSHIIDNILLNITSDVKFVSPEAWIGMFTVFLSKNLSIRTKFTFQVYSAFGPLNRERVGLAVEKFFPGEDDDEIQEMRSDMLEFIFNKFDHDKDGVISYDEYSKTVERQPPLMEFLGQVFPEIPDLTLIAHCMNLESIYRFQPK